MDSIFSPVTLSGHMVAPASKSETHRRLICAGLSREESSMERVLVSKDIEATIRCLEALGTDVTTDDTGVRVRGFARKKDLLPIFDTGESGSTLRFFVPLALTICGGGIFRMHGNLGKRPMDIYRDLFVPQGVSWHMGIGADEILELVVQGQMESGEYVIPGNVSSQFVSGLLFALPLLRGNSTLEVVPPVESEGYIHMTVQAIRDCGIEIREEKAKKRGLKWTIPGGQQYRARNGAMHGDWSQAAVLLCADALGSSVQLEGLREDSLQGDKSILECLEQMGARIVREEGGIRVEADRLHGMEFDMQDRPDIAPMLALVCQMAEGTSILRGCDRLKLKECDRLAGTVNILNVIGGKAREEKGSIVIEGVSHLKGGCELRDEHDHRMVMLASIAALVCEEPLTVHGVESLEKSWPDYLEVYKALGGKVS
ncbi:MAG: 3-phosphoshikimate 1-carboxyvinyltransferase [Clostridia bacterium]|nr:3-phosphoshikimate 1-carboxyvinyltransferase [Clostridia bacterium]